MDHTLINRYFPNLSPEQQQQFAALGPSYQSWNGRINVISRKDIDQIYLHHVLHSLAIAKYTSFPDGARVLDVGTGGGFPGIPLSILFPHTQFCLCDSIAKKIRVIDEVITTLGITNVSAAHIRAEEIKQSFDYVVCRAVAPLYELASWVWNKIDKGMICLKGGDLDEELAIFTHMTGISKEQIEEIPVSQWFYESFFEGKKIISILKKK